MNHGVRAKKYSCILLSLFLIFLLTACRDSPVLRQLVYTQDADTADYTQEMLDPEDLGRIDERFENRTDDEAETPRDAEEDQGLEDLEGDLDKSMDVEYNDRSENDWQAGDAPEEETPPALGNGQGPVTGDTDPPEDEGVSVPSDEITYKQVVDANGGLVDVPENVETVTAVGAAAQMVEMLGGSGRLLGGSGRLLGADEALLRSELAGLAFADRDEISAWWSGDGSGGITEASFAALLSAQPDVCFEISGERTFTNGQVERLAQAGIAYVVLPALSSQDNLKQAVTLVGQVLGGDAQAKADAYNAWVDDAVKDVGGKTSGTDLTSLYISDWDYAAGYQLNDTKGAIEASGSGLAVAYSPKKAQLVSTFMSAAGVVNESTRIRSLHRDSEGVYVAPMFHQFSPIITGSKAVYYSGAGEYGSAYDLFVARMVSDTVYYQLGSTSFPAVIVENEQIKAELEQNWFWQYHETDGSGYIRVGDQSFYCGVIGEYDIFVNPQGMCNWAQGSVESPLEAYWVAYRFAGSCTLQEVAEKTRDFYKTFFGTDLTEEQLSQILGEKVELR